MKISMKIITNIMFYKKKTSSKKKIKINKLSLRLKPTVISKQPLELYNCINHTDTSIFVYQTKATLPFKISRPIVLRFSRLSNLNPITAEKYMNLVCSDLVKKFSFNSLYFVLKKLF